MTQVEWAKVLEEINAVFKNQFDKLDSLENRVKELEDLLNEKENNKRPKAKESGSKRVQQAKENA